MMIIRLTRWKVVMMRDNGLAGEPAVDELLADPVLHLLMRRDGISEQELRRLVQTTARQLADAKG